MRKIFFFLFPALLLTCEKPRIFELIPGMEDNFCPLLVEPALPEDYVAYSTGDDLFANEIIWGRKATIEKFQMALQEDRADLALKELKSPVIMVFMTQGQKEPEQDLEEFTLSKTIWNRRYNTYPVVALEGRDEEGKKIYTAYVDLNDPEGYVMQFNFIYPQARDEPTDDELQIWKNFIENTETLPERDYLEGNGIDLYKGYTIYKQPCGIHVKLLAEKKKSTGQFRIAARPMNEQTFISMQSAQETILETEWHHGESALKVSCSIRSGNTILTPVISIAYKVVEEFSFESEIEIPILH